jgi:type VI secretion system secreted protein Hcp
MAEIPVGILKFPGGEIEGETDLNVPFRDAKNPSAAGMRTEKGVDVLSFSFSGSTAGSSQGVGGFTGSKVHLQPFHFTKKADQSSAKLYEFCANGKMIPLAHFVVLRQSANAGDEASNLETYYAYAFTNIVISSYMTGGSPGDDGRPHEEISFSFEQFDFVYGQQLPGEVAGWLKAFYNQKTERGG